MKTEAKRLNAVIRDIHLCSNLMRSRADELHKDLGVNASMRSVMAVLYMAVPKTVPDIGRAKGVSRQHIQIVVNALLKKGLLESGNNPADKRTYLVSLSETGNELYSKIQAREFSELQILSENLNAEEIRTASKMIQKLSRMIRNNIH